MANQEDTSSSTDESDYAPALGEAPEFVKEQCLFCNRTSDSLDSNVTHMQLSHGLFLRDLVHHLIVELETLVRYLHLVIFRFHECLNCHSQRRTAEAAQQHMLGKQHCNIDDIHDPNSEYRDFFDFTADSDSEEESTDAQNFTSGANSDSVRLPSGRTVTRRTADLSPATHRKPPRRPASAPSKQREPLSSAGVSAESGPSPPLEPAVSQPPSSSELVSRSERRSDTLSNQLVHLSANDRLSLAHLPSSEQRAVLATQNKQMDKARRAELKRRSRVEMLQNKTLMEHFIADTPAMKLRYAWC
jgi:pre-60S factor REI1